MTTPPQCKCITKVGMVQREENGPQSTAIVKSRKTPQTVSAAPDHGAIH